MSKSKEKLNKIKKGLYLQFNQFRVNFRIQKKGLFYRFVIHEKYREAIKTIRYYITLVSLFSAFFVFQSVLYAFLFGAAIHFLGVFVDNAAFLYNSLYIHYLPDFKLKPEKWTACFFGHVQPPNSAFQIPFIGWTHNDEKYARKIHSLISKWVENDLKDTKNNLCMSIVILNDEEYIFFCYPNLEKEKAELFYKEVEKERKKTSLTDKHFRESFVLILGKKCIITPSSYFPTFLKRYSNRTPYFFRITLDPKIKGGNPITIKGLNDFYFNELKIKYAKDLTRKDIEYEAIKFK